MKFFRKNYARRVRFLLETLQSERTMALADVGANPIRDPDYKSLYDLGGCRIFGFEPGEEAYNKLDSMQTERSKYFNVAVGSEAKGRFYPHPIGSIASLFKIHRPSAQFLGKGFWFRPNLEPIDIDLVALDKIEDLPTLDVLKMDVQGAELSVLKSGRKKLAEAMVVIPEVRFYRMYEDEPMWSDVDQELRKQGFVLHRVLFAKSVTLPSTQSKKFGKRKMASQWLDGDAVYIRNIDDPEKISTEQFKHLALAADAIFQSFDLCLMCLDRLIERGAIASDAAQKYFRMLPPSLRSAET